MINWIIIGLAFAYSVYVLVRFWKKSKRGACAGCAVQAGGQTPAGCPGCASGLSEEALEAIRSRRA
ncbi:FeoB-associated Cys-rich membrane protein [Saccharibacillus alkalitolerans]|uniref:FeoB-associated Cys-rich membrane protein n=1 Tax=Saccharibacillus alkalitolerans TaxID=2705290 RepID=A0ABX0F4K9_9BACL|nr:FeoB-associated Cys-rich membrane protein [Saccharibacillus alkalitolerans]NGZ75907.1 FeoB-associated Cys-rich membrane protein [Saccharibacillus alkalitolerans]